MGGPNSIRDTFFEECEDLLEALAEGLAQMADGTHETETINAVFRAVHSIKGGAGAFGLNELVAFSHRFEAVLDGLRSDRIQVDHAVIHTLLRAADHLADLVECARDGRREPTAPTAGFLAALSEISGVGGPDPIEVDTEFVFEAQPITIDLPADSTIYIINFHPTPALFANGHDPILIFAALADLGRLEVTLDCAALPDWQSFDPAGSYLAWSLRLETSEPETVLHEVFEFVEGLCTLYIAPERVEHPLDEKPALHPNVQVALPSPPVESRPTSADTPESRGPKPTLRVDLERVDRLINAVGELIINQAVIEQSLSQYSVSAGSEFATHVEDYRLLARDIQEAVMAIRAQPVKPLFQRMSRILREAADATEKNVRLVTSGDSTEVDKTVIERLADPLTHMIRNAVDHGIETPEQRVSAGKNAEGTVFLQAAHRSGNVVITVRDDGLGLNRASIRAKAVRQGLVAAHADLSDPEIDNLLFTAGFSTADKISNLSGRGVGLDVVKNAVTALGGRIAIASTPGEGTEFTVTLPLTLAVMDGMVVSVAGQTMVVPITSVIETIRPAPEDLHTIGTSETVLSMRGNFIPMIDVAAALGFVPQATREPPLVLLIETDTQSQCALIVDAVQDQRQIVVKGLETNYGPIPGVAAATVLGNGQIALILDPDALTSNRHVPPAPAAAA